MKFQLTYFCIMMMVLLVVLLFPSCVNTNYKESPAEWEDTPNPLDTPGDSEDTVKALHEKNSRIIRGLPPI